MNEYEIATKIKPAIITKSEAIRAAQARDKVTIDWWLRALETAIREKYNGVSASVVVEKALPKHILDKLMEILESAGWKVAYTPPGGDQRDSWVGYLQVS